MENISLTTIIRRDSKQIFSNVDAEVIMLSLNKGNYYALNKVGSRIWNLINQPIQVNSLIECLTKEFNVSKNSCEKKLSNSSMNLIS